MKKTMLHRIALHVFVVLALVAVPSLGTSSDAQDDLSVSIGKSSIFLKTAYAHDISREALREGKTEFVVKTSDTETFTVKLSEKQVEDILAGSTVILETQEDVMKVKVGPYEKPAAPKSGW